MSVEKEMMVLSQEPVKRVVAVEESAREVTGAVCPR